MSVFLNNVDDYLAPAQACVNPLFSGSPKTDDGEDTTEAAAVAPTPNGQVVARRKRRVRRPVEAATVPIPVTPATETVKASMADCLACSGCVTTAETVLLEETHSLDLLRKRWNTTDDSTSSGQPALVLTISPAAWADWLRLLSVAEDESNNDQTTTRMSVEQHRQLQRQWTTILCQTLGAVAVLDGNSPLQWSLDSAVDEFCEQFNRQQNTTQIAASCPAVVCLVEKSVHGAVPLLSKTPSAQAFAGRFWKTNHSQRSVLHAAVMPCHDKKLEASRPALFGTEDSTAGGTTTTTAEQDVDLVLTTQDCLTLVYERLGISKDAMDNDMQCLKTLRQTLAQATPLATVVELTTETGTNVVDTILANHHHNKNNPATPTLMVPPLDQLEVATSTSHDANTSESSIFVHASGGYADYIFRQAAKRLFGVTHLPVVLPWQPVVVGGNASARQVSARVKAATQREYYQVALYPVEGGYSVVPPPASNSTTKPVLQFALAYGMQTLQRVLAPWNKDGSVGAVTSTNQNVQSPSSTIWHYVEAMACPSGCVNGGGQVRLTETVGSGARERPTQTKARVKQTRDQMMRPVSASHAPIPPPAITFRAVPPLELAQGAVKGVAVKDVQW